MLLEYRIRPCSRRSKDTKHHVLMEQNVLGFEGPPQQHKDRSLCCWGTEKCCHTGYSETYRVPGRYAVYTVQPSFYVGQSDHAGRIQQLRPLPHTRRAVRPTARRVYIIWDTMPALTARFSTGYRTLFNIRAKVEIC